jgi:hypothetical protein
MKIETLQRVKTYLFLFPVLLALLPSSTAFAQAGRGSISGTITDPSGAVVPGVKVTLHSGATGNSQHSTSSGAGLYSFISLSPGTYQISASGKGFESFAENNINVTVDQDSKIDIKLSVGNASQIVTVTASTDLLDASSSTVGALIDAATIDRVPLLTRNVYDLVQLSAGVTPANGTPNSSSSFAITNISSGRPGVDVSSYTINGAIVGSVYYMVDGSPLGISENNAAAIIPALDIPEDAVEEFRVETQNTPASFQSGGAGVISLATKSGTNHFHGDAFVYLRPDVLAANDYFNKNFQLQQGLPNESLSFHRYQEGGSFSGPILHDKLFFFGDYEATQQEQFDGSNTFSVPTSAERTGDFSADSFNIYNPLVPDNPDGTRQQFPGNRIANPNPIAVHFLSEMPKCNAPNPTTCDSATNGAANNFYLPGLDPTTAQRFDIRMDYTLNEKQRIFGRFSFDRLFNSLFNAFGNAYDLNYAQNITNGRNILIGDDYTIDNNTVLQLRYSFTRHYEDQGGDPAQNGISLTSLGFPASLQAEENYQTLPYITFNDLGGGVGGTANYNTFQYASENSDFNGTVTKIFGKHQLSFGAEYMKRFLNVGQPGAPSGAYGFDISATDQQTSTGLGGSDFASFLTGVGTGPGSEGTNFTKDLFLAEANPYYALFIEDTYHPKPSLTITAGLRWDIFAGKTERHNRLAYFDSTATNTVNGDSYTGAEVYVNGSNRSPFTTNMKDFGPRLAAAWQPQKRLVLRGGFGIYYGPSVQMVGGASLDSDGYSTVTNWNATCYNADGNSTLNGSNLCLGAGPGASTPTPTGPYSLSNPFPVGVVPVIAHPTGLGNNLGTILDTMLHSQRTQTIYNFNAGIEYEIPGGYIFSVGYVGSRGLFLPFGGVDLNELSLQTIGKYQAAILDTQVPNTYVNTQPITNANYGLATAPLFTQLEAYPQFGDGYYGDGVGLNGNPAGDSDYSSLQSKLQKHLTKHVTALASFTWAKLLTDDGNPPLGFVGAHNGAAQDWRNLNLEHSVSPQDVKFQFTGQASYDLPIGKGRGWNLSGWSDSALGGWTLNGIFYLSTGIPVPSPGSGGTVLGLTSTDPGITAGYFAQRADLTCDPGKGAPHTVSRWLNPGCFALPATPFVPGTAPAYLDHLRTEGADDVDLTIFKTLTLPREMSIRFEVSAFNIANRVQLGNPNIPSPFIIQQNPGTYLPTYGQVTYDVNTPRQFQFGSKFTF